MQEEGKAAATDFAREEFVAKIQAWKDEYEQTITDQLKAMGCSCDWDRQAFTMDEPRAKAVREAFFQLFKDGLIYRGKRLVNWDPVTQTALADDEVEMEEVDGHFYYLQVPARPTARGHVTRRRPRAPKRCSATPPSRSIRKTRARSDLRGKHVRLPIVNRVIPIIEDDYVVLPVAHGGDPADVKAQFATGFLKVTPAHDPNDYDIGQRHNLPMINVMAPDGSISDKHGWTRTIGRRAEFLLGMIARGRAQAGRRVVQGERPAGGREAVPAQRRPQLSQPRADRAVPERSVVLQGDGRAAGRRRAAARWRTISSKVGSGLSRPEQSGRVPANATTPSAIAALSTGGCQRGKASSASTPPRYAKTFQTWHENIRDWCISRQLWWGHRIPVWTRPMDAGDDSRSGDLSVLHEAERCSAHADRSHDDGARATIGSTRT